MLVFFAYKLSQVDTQDRTHPFGTDTLKNKKYAKGKVGEDYGVNIFWGLPSKKDTTQKHLDKIQWLTHSYKTDVIWRRCFFVSTFGSIFGVLSINPKLIFSPRHIISIFLIIFISSYLLFGYYSHHFLWRRAKFIDIHIQKLKKDLKIPQYNRINQNLLI